MSLTSISPLLIARIQFATTITFHILFPAFSIGLATYLLIIESLYLKTKKKVYYQTARFWSKVLALTFGMGIISGLAMEFQIGTNWSGFSNIVGPVLGVLFTLEALTAFFIEATFLGIMLFGWHLFSRRVHYLATWMVFIGVSLSAFWILAANSWMQTPAGAVLHHGHFIVTSWLAVIFNHSTLIRYAHMLLASYLATAFLIIGVASYYVLKKRHRRFAKTNLKTGLIIAASCILLQIYVGDTVGLEVHHYQPIKTAAIEGVWHSQRGAPLLLFANIHQHSQSNTDTIGIPHLAAVINTHHWNGKIQGLDSVKQADRPDVLFVFYSFRIMVGLGLAMLVLSWLGIYFYKKNSLFEKTWLLKIFTWFSPAGFIALVTGWYTAECGRQPWVVYGILPTSAGASSISAMRLMVGFILILLIYGLIFGVGYLTYLKQTIQQGPIVKPRKRNHLIKSPAKKGVIEHA